MRSLFIIACAFSWTAIVSGPIAQADPRAAAMQGAWLQAKLQTQGQSFSAGVPSWSPKPQTAGLPANPQPRPTTVTMMQQQTRHRELCLRAAWLNKRLTPAQRNAALDSCVRDDDTARETEARTEQGRGKADEAPQGLPRLCVPTTLAAPKQPVSSQPLKRPRGLGPTHYTPPKNQPPPRRSTLVALELLQAVGMSRLAQQQERCSTDASLFPPDL